LRLRLTGLIPLFVFAICFTAWVPVSINVSGLNLRVSQLLLPIILGLVVVQRPIRSLTRTSVLLLAASGLMWGSLLVWTLISPHTPAGVRPLARVILMGLNLLHVVAIYLLVVRTRQLRVALNAFVASVAWLNLFLAFQAIAITAGVPIPSTWLAEEGAPMLVDGALVGGTILRFIFSGINGGCLSAAAMVVAVATLLDRQYAAPRWYKPALAAVSMGVVLGFSRQAIVSLALGLAVIGAYLFVRGKALPLLRMLFLALVLSILALAGTWVTPGGRQYVQALAGRVVQLFQPQAYATGTVSNRVVMWGGMWDDIREDPLAGQGQDAYLVHQPVENIEGSHNFPLEIWHSAGLIGLLGYLAIHLGAVGLAWAWLARRHAPSNLRWPILGLLGAFIAVWAASTTNLLYWNPSYWMVMGLVLAAVRLAQVSRPRYSAAPR
jgi:O-antigen ligase